LLLEQFAAVMMLTRHILKAQFDQLNCLFRSFRYFADLLVIAILENAVR
jgi:hypothetical protein